jgi:hypothetical protein
MSKTQVLGSKRTRPNCVPSEVREPGLRNWLPLVPVAAFGAACTAALLAAAEEVAAKASAQSLETAERKGKEKLTNGPGLAAHLIAQLAARDTLLEYGQTT